MSVYRRIPDPVQSNAECTFMTRMRPSNHVMDVYLAPKKMLRQALVEGPEALVGFRGERVDQFTR
jgi:hypothetical protein